MTDDDLKVTENPERDQATLAVVEDEIKLLEADIRQLQQELEALCIKRRHFADWRGKLLTSARVGQKGVLQHY